ncbi:helix-turn-helix transcriptional regulator [Ochrobactrum sp. CGA5]|uniref:helix-turn-helix domain-containing protein n=1 Tax=Ochrobactrum sp. CGA5 TaxID=2583453 RepID=UPI001121852A|nr:helix-turn-helix transcriptional regulator [Ochrobactrum sp. CGA5]
MDIQQQVALNHRRIRVSRGISQDDLALTAGVERSYVGHLERGVKNPTIKTLEKLAFALNCKVADFFAEPDEEALLRNNLRPGRRSQTDTKE